ncbi:TPA: DUF4116 domain-containing protein [Clostridioides difficile]|nr:DUF4116 domain-containing protein [Clostridioides difficile]HBF2935838.1 DUF4116 domain-containing protein [Clostridioides difficile]HBF3306941.1 DUF4116 domain-containing protein [Clostridioides difficile]HBZ0282633.1 DUF4116 domain-containing protein [Clostridioides difficile]
MRLSEYETCEKFQDYQICKTIVRDYPPSIKVINWDELNLTKEEKIEIYMYAIARDYTLLRYLKFDDLSKEQTEEIFLEAVKEDGLALEYVKWNELEGELSKDQIDEICMEAVKKDGLALKYVNNQTEKICIEAVKRNGLALQYVKDQTEEICKKAVIKNELALEFVEEQFSEICIEEINKNGIVFRYLKNICRKVVEIIKMGLTYVVLLLPFLIPISFIFFLSYTKEKEAYQLDYQLEYNIAESIEANKSVSLANMVKENFDKVCIYYSYSMFEPNKGEFQYLPTAKHYNKEIPKNNFSYIVFLDEDGEAIKSIVLNKKYDILGNRSYMEYSKKDSLFKFKKVKGVNEYSYELN